MVVGIEDVGPPIYHRQCFFTLDRELNHSSQRRMEKKCVPIVRQLPNSYLIRNLGRVGILECLLFAEMEYIVGTEIQEDFPLATIPAWEVPGIGGREISDQGGGILVLASPFGQGHDSRQR